MRRKSSLASIGQVAVAIDTQKQRRRSSAAGATEGAAGASSGSPARRKSVTLRAAGGIAAASADATTQRPLVGGRGRKSISGAEEPVPATDAAVQFFKLFDENGDAKIDREEWLQIDQVLREHMPAMVMQKLSESGTFEDVDQDKDGAIDLEEWKMYVAAWEQLLGPRQLDDLVPKVQESLEVQRSQALAERRKKRASRTSFIEQDSLTWLSSDWLRPGSSGLVSFSEDERAILQGYFEMYDADESGTVDFNELRPILADIGRSPQGPSQDEDDKLYRALRSRAIQEQHEELVFDAFVAFLEAFYQGIYRRVFFAYADESAQTIDATRDKMMPLFEGLIEAGFTVPRIYILENFADMIAKIDVDNSGSLDFDEFCILMRDFRKMEYSHLKKYAGFSEEYHSCLTYLFREVDSDGSGCLELREIITLMGRVMSAASVTNKEEFEAFVLVVARMDKDRSCSLDFEEFLRLLRVWSSRVDGAELTVEALMGNSGIDCKETFKLRFSRIAEHGMIEGGSEVTEQIVMDGLEYDVEDGVLAHQFALNFHEIRVLRECFEFADMDGSMSINQRELELLLKTMGTPMKTEQQRAALASCKDDPNLQADQGGRKFRELLMLMVAYHDALAKELLRQFEPDAVIPIDQLVSVLYNGGLYLTPDVVMELLERARQACRRRGTIAPPTGYVDEAQLKILLRLSRERQQLEWAESFGFDEETVGKVKTAMRRHSGQNLKVKGKAAPCHIDIGKIFPVLEELRFTVRTEDQKRALGRALMRVDPSFTGRKLTLSEVLLLMRHLQNLHMVQERALFGGLGDDSDTTNNDDN